MVAQIDGLVQYRINPIANNLELQSCTQAIDSKIDQWSQGFIFSADKHITILSMHSANKYKAIAAIQIHC